MITARNTSALAGQFERWPCWPPRRPYPQRCPAIDCNPTPSCVNGGSGAEDLKDADLTDRNLTARQGAVLELLSRGSSNKVIARRLAMSEGTVKFHVRQIMCKFGVTNRTQVAVVCGAGGEVAPVIRPH